MTEVGFIPGIYNYCDRWCEKCEQKSQCMSFVMGKKIEERGGFDLDEEVIREDDNIWSRLKDVFESTYEVLHELAKERGIDVEDIYASENINKEFWGEDYENNELKGSKNNLVVENSDIIRLCLIYEDLADKCLEKIFEELDESEKQGNKRSKEVDEALDVINWYLDLIQAKVRRGLFGYYRFTEKLGEEMDDYNGSAKVALIAVGRSVCAWNIIVDVYPEYGREVRQLFVVLEQLREDITKQFPDAENFLRPGFDI